MTKPMYTLKADFKSRSVPVAPETHKSKSRGYLCTLFRCMYSAYPHGEYRLFNSKGKEEQMYDPRFPVVKFDNLTPAGQREYWRKAERFDPQGPPPTRASYPIPATSTQTTLEKRVVDYKFLPLNKFFKDSSQPKFSPPIDESGPVGSSQEGEALECRRT